MSIRARMRRARILDRLSIVDSVGVEIGALDRPLVTSDMGTIIYVDHADTETLQRKYADNAGVRTEAIVRVDGIWGENTLLDAIGGRHVDYVIASHVIEHVPDLITWLNELEAVLQPGGQIRLAIPDKRYTFDCLRRETTFSDVLPAYLMRARRPMPREVMDFIYNVADVRHDRLWHRPARTVARRLYGYEEAARIGESSMRGEYHDVHCWTFTPVSFAQLMDDIGRAGLTGLECAAFIDTPLGDNEFYVTLAAKGAATNMAWSTIQRKARANPGDNPLRAAVVLLHPFVFARKLKRLRDRNRGQCT